MVIRPSNDLGATRAELVYRLGFGVAVESTLAMRFDRLFPRYAPYVAAIGLRILGRDDEVDDLVQDVFLIALRGLAKMRDPAAIKGWLGTVAVRVARRKLRTRKLKGLLLLDADTAYEEIVDGSASPEHRVLLTQVYRVLDRLPVDQRIPWALRNIQGEKMEAIAQMCECSLSTVKRRIAEAQTAVEGAVSDV